MVRRARWKIIVFLFLVVELTSLLCVGRVLYLWYLWDMVWDMRYGWKDRERAMRKIIDIRPADCTSQLENLIEVGSDHQIRVAVSGLQALGKRAARPVLARLVKSAGSHSRLSVAYCVRHSTDPEDLALLKELLEDCDQEVRLKSHQVLLIGGDLSVVPWLIEIMSANREAFDDDCLQLNALLLEHAFPGGPDLFHKAQEWRRMEVYEAWLDWWRKNKDTAVVSASIRSGFPPPWPRDD